MIFNPVLVNKDRKLNLFGMSQTNLQKYLGVTLDLKLTFEEHLQMSFKKLSEL